VTAHGLTVIMPAYNEEAGISEAVSEVQREVLDQVEGAGAIVINDGSRDRTGSILDALAASDGRIRVIHQANGGHGAALLTGLAAAPGEWILLVDSDRQIPLTSFAGLWSEASARDVVLGVRVQRKDPITRRLLSATVRTAILAMFGVRLRDANAPCKLIRRSVWLRVRAAIPPGTLAPSIFLAIQAVRLGLRVTEVDVPHRPRATGVASLRSLRLLRFCFRGFRQLLGFRFHRAP
jgi:glycosyltransferase involved in cell wall biosynthesis